MKLTKVHLFIVLLLALVLCSFFGGSCAGDSGLEGFNMPSDSTPYDGTGQYSDKFSSYGDMYKANDKFSKQQDKAYDRKDKPLPPNNGTNAADDDDSKYASYDSAGAGSGAGSGASGSISSRHGSDQGISASQIIPGQEDLYILKSAVVPPVCPACPAVKCNSGGGGGGGGGGGNGGNNKCPPCPPCARCPEPAFECKKVPNYNSGNDNVLPRPVLADFSQFGL
jgi:hypothetical protein